MLRELAAQEEMQEHLVLVVTLVLAPQVQILEEWGEPAQTVVPVVLYMWEDWWEIIQEQFRTIVMQQVT
jgi:hypothetical protein